MKAEFAVHILFCHFSYCLRISSFFADTCSQFCRENGCMKPSCEAVHAMWLPFRTLQATTTETKEDRVWKTEREPKSQHMVKSQDPKRED